MYGIFTNIYPINDSNVGKYAIHGSYGFGRTTNITADLNVLQKARCRQAAMTEAHLDVLLRRTPKA